jgi:hypothetical protein
MQNFSFVLAFSIDNVQNTDVNYIPIIHYDLQHPIISDPHVEK